ncbi:MAG TPA: GlsB/YeaQ/YmgE family stress response membrane protein [Mycobacteriales bacterium]|nr:GlsB/YeaQ/YmgE family stress response membrane protein [Mycobacteriales bacterium]
MLLTIIGMIIVGLIAGFLARAIVPGDDSMGIVQTIVLGIVGSFVGGFLASLLFGGGDGEGFLRPSGLIGSVIGAIIALVVYNAVTGRKKSRV